MQNILAFELLGYRPDDLTEAKVSKKIGLRRNPPFIRSGKTADMLVPRPGLTQARWP